MKKSPVLEKGHRAGGGDEIKQGHSLTPHLAHGGDISRQTFFA